jgi:hypothetical protein
MGMARSWEETEQLSRPELIRLYDAQAKRTDVEGLSFIREVIFQRDLAAQGDRMEAMTRQIQKLTWAIVWLTVVNTAGVIATLAVELRR